MKTKAIFLAAILLVGCQASRQETQVPVQHAQSLSSAHKQNEVGKYTDNSREDSARWLNDESGPAQQNLWNFISSELKMKVQDNALIREQRRKYLKNKSYLHNVTLRAEPYMDLIISQIKKRNMPMELVLIPIVESAFDPRATSYANAAGLWQIIPSTARYYGLKQNQWYDGRRDVLASTNAALDLMQNLNREFKGDWLHTIAAYNSGEGRVAQAIKTNRAKGKPTDFWALSLPRETSLYVPKMLALSDIIKNSKKYGFNLPATNENRGLARVDVGRQIHLTQASEMSGLSLAKLKSYNLGYKRNVTAPNGPHYIMLPKSHAIKLKKSLAETNLATTIPSELARNNVTTSSGSQYQVQSGDTLSAIAKRLNIKINDLQNWNNIHLSSTLKVGQILQLANNTHNNGIIYKVRAGDSAASIAKHHGINVSDLMRWNSVINQSDILQPGLKLTLFVTESMNPDT